MNPKDILIELNKNYNFPSSLISNVDTLIYSNDDMYIDGEDKHYYGVGFSCLDIIRSALMSSDVSKESINSILIFPCGYGRELRFIKEYFPQAKITGGEISEEKTKFVSEHFKIKTFQSKRNFQKIELDKKFDLIWCGSLFTHLSAKNFKKLLRFFVEHLNDNGLLMFTTHGRYVKERFDSFKYGLRFLPRIYVKAKYSILGFGYTSYLKQYRYGVSLSNPSWVLKQIEKYEDIRMTGFLEKKWDSH
jgi:SAM-dependent methyltransferase